MKIIKPQKLSLLTRVFEHGQECHLVLTTFAWFPFSAPSRLLPEVSLWRSMAVELGQGAALDFGMPKAKGEVLVSGKAYAPGGKPRPSCAVRLKIGPVDKTLYAIGDRRWGLAGMSDPEPFAEMPITYANAFGGVGYALNPAGKGAGPVDGPAGRVHPLPNIEDPRRLIKSPRDEPGPAGFGPYDYTWPQRFSKLGTYDDAWLREMAPGFPRDLDLAAFNAAPEDQRIDGAFRGDEAFVLENMHPEKPRLTSCLPGVAARIFATLRTGSGERLVEVGNRIDTVQLFPHIERGIVTSRGLLPIAEDDAADVVHVMAAFEALGQRKPLEHYEEVLQQRLDRKRAHLYALRDSDLMPPEPEGPHFTEDRSDMEAFVQNEGILHANLRRRAEQAREEARQRVAERGLDPDKYGPPPLPPPEPAPRIEELPAVVAKAEATMAARKVELQEEKEKATRQAREAFAKMGLDYDKVVLEQQKKQAGPPRLSAKENVDRLRATAENARKMGAPNPEVEAMLAEPHLEKRFLRLEEMMITGYRKFGHLGVAAERLEGEAARAAREAVRAAYERGERLDGHDLTGADLSGLDLKNASFRGAFLESARLGGSNLEGADFTDAVLARADLSRAMLTRARLTRANLGGAKLAAAVLEGADLTGVVLTRADLTDAKLVGAVLTRAELSEAIFGSTDLTGASAEHLQLIRADLRGLTCRGVSFGKSVFVECRLEGVDLSGARLISAVFITVQGDGASFRGATLDNVRMVVGCSFNGSDFRGASLPRANLRGASLAGCDFSGADIESADLSECVLRDAKLALAKGKDARFVRADLSGADVRAVNLMGSMLTKAKVHDADFAGSNLFRADLAGARGDERTRFEGANVKEVRTLVRGSRGLPGGAHGQR